MMTNAVQTSNQAVSPLFGTGTAGASAAAGAAEAAATGAALSSAAYTREFGASVATPKLKSNALETMSLLIQCFII